MRYFYCPECGFETSDADVAQTHGSTAAHYDIIGNDGQAVQQEPYTLIVQDNPTTDRDGYPLDRGVFDVVTGLTAEALENLWLKSTTAYQCATIHVLHRGVTVFDSGYSDTPVPAIRAIFDRIQDQIKVAKEEQQRIDQERNLERLRREDAKRKADDLATLARLKAKYES